MKQFDAMKRLASIEGRLTLLMVLAYSIGGLLGLLLGSPSPVFPPAGLALGTLLCLGNRAVAVRARPGRPANHRPERRVLEEERRQTRESGMNAFHPKPIDLPELKRQIRQLCKAREMAPGPIHSITIP